MNTMEIEFKFCIPAGHLKAVEAALRRGAVVRTRLQARYFDTADQRLVADGMVLRLRKEGRRWVQTVKAAGDNALHRLEHNVDLGTGAAAPPSTPPATPARPSASGWPACCKRPTAARCRWSSASRPTSCGSRATCA